jgi:hypothetical protein
MSSTIEQLFAVAQRVQKRGVNAENAVGNTGVGQEVPPLVQEPRIEKYVIHDAGGFG